MQVIQQLEKGDVHRICSGQVVVDLATAVKELVENSLDAGATSIEVTIATIYCCEGIPAASWQQVRLREGGLQGIEVGDNGPGIDSCNYLNVLKKHATSKLSCFADLSNVRSGALTCIA